jgi:hypothetical protein
LTVIFWNGLIINSVESVERATRSADTPRGFGEAVCQLRYQSSELALGGMTTPPLLSCKAVVDEDRFEPISFPQQVKMADYRMV